MESHSPRQLRRYLDYGKLVKRQEVSEEFWRWLMRILLEEGVYETEECTLAFELAACEWLLSAWEQLAQTPPAHLFIAHSLDRLTLYLCLLDDGLDWNQRAAYWHLFAQQYGKHHAWIDEVHAQRSADAAEFASGVGGEGFSALCSQLRGVIEQEAPPTGRSAAEVESLRQEIGRCEEALKVMEGDLEFAEDRADRAHARIRKLDEEVQGLRRQLTDERENGEKLRSERRSRIASQRQSSEAQKELETLRREYIKMDGRLKEMAGRLALAEQRGARQVRWDLTQLRGLSDVELLGISAAEGTPEQVGQVRRRFASVLHPDRVRDLPAWAGGLFAELMGVINEACDRSK